MGNKQPTVCIFKASDYKKYKKGVLHFFLSAFQEGDPDRLLLPTDSNGIIKLKIY